MTHSVRLRFPALNQ
ncbi:erythromycin resistance leader peptide [Gracilibacillus orientalis]